MTQLPLSMCAFCGTTAEVFHSMCVSCELGRAESMLKLGIPTTVIGTTTSFRDALAILINQSAKLRITPEECLRGILDNELMIIEDPSSVEIKWKILSNDKLINGYCLHCGSVLRLNCGYAEPDFDDDFCSKGCYVENKNEDQ